MSEQEHICVEKVKKEKIGQKWRDEER